ncbi:odorant receptor 23a-like isoform X1 [Onthophagus taurus]|uniref:odorant receptor 23a-like isoform X1 n=1 Tax=Onthophagus taurus TaxID=166361 RepID=UPI0039BE7A3C
MKLKHFKGFLKWNIWLSIPGGLWDPKVTGLYLNLYKIYKYVILTFVFCWYVLTEFISVSATYNDLFETSNTLNIAIMHLGGTVKCCMFVFRGDNIREIVNKMENNEFNYENAKNCNLRSIINRYKKLGKITTVILYSFATAYFLLAFLPYIYEYLKSLVTKDRLTNKPYNMWMPFNHDTPLKYGAMLLYQGLPHFAFIHAIIGSDTLLINLMNLIACHLVILQGAFRTIEERCQLKIKKDNFKLTLNETMVEEFKKMVRHLQVVIESFRELESFQSYINLAQVGLCTFVFCSCLLLLSMSTVGSNEFITYMVYMGTALIELGIYCAFGNNVTVQAQLIPNAIWESNWMDTTVSYKKMMILTMQRMQKPMFLTIGKFATLTLSTFTAVLKLSYSIFAILENRDAN